MHRLLSELSDEVAAAREGAPDDGAPLPPNFREAVRWLASPRLLGSARHRELKWKLDQAGLHPDLREFLRVFDRACASLRIPIHGEGGRALAVRHYVTGKTKSLPSESPFATGRAVLVVSSLRGDDLPPLALELLGHIGAEIAKRNSLEVEWGGATLWRLAHAG